MTLIVRWFINALALMLVAYLYSGVKVEGIFAALIAALVLGHEPEQERIDDKDK